MSQPIEPRQIPSRGTSGMAVASFVLSLVWIAGVGSILAVVFAVGALRRIGRSGGTMGGNGLAVAGLTLGIVGLLGAVLFWIFVVAIGQGVQQAAREFDHRTVTVDKGQPVNLPEDEGSSIRTVTLLSLMYPVPPPSEFERPAPGKELAVAEIQVCAGPSGSQTGPVTLLFELVFPNGQEVGESFFEAKGPSLSRIDALGANQCGQGFITYEIASGTEPQLLRYSHGPFRTYEWIL